MKAIQIISQDVFDKIRSRFQNLEMGDETGAVTIDPGMARFFDFDFVNEGNNLGRVSISLNDLGSLKIYYSQGITENQDDPAKQIWYNFLKEMRMFAMRRLLRFDTRDIAKTNLDKNDFQHLAATQGPKEEEPMNTMNESRWNHKSTKKTSRAVQGKTEVIVRHAKAVDEEYAGSRSQRKNIKAIFIQNSEGERFKYPFIHPAGAFAMAQHVDHGGIPHDPAGKAIISMSEQIAQLQEFQRKIQRTSLHDDATGITERAVGRLQELKARIDSLGKRHHYECWMAEFNEQEHMDNDIMELDAVTMEQYKQTFTQTSFQEELASYFPLLHRIMSEANKVDLEDYVGEEAEVEEAEEAEVKESAFDAFESWAEAVEQGKLTDDEIQALKQALADQPQLELTTAYNFFNEFGIDDSDLEDKFRQAADLDSSTDPMVVFQLWAQENYPELLVALGMSGTQAPAEPAPAPEQPMAEGMDVNNVLSNIEKEVRQQAGHDDWELIQIKLLDAALKMVGRDKRSVYEPDVLNVMDWDDAAEFLNTVANDAGQSENTQFVVWYMVDDGEWDKKGTFKNEAAADAYIQQLAAKGYDDDNFEVLKPGQHPDDDYAYTGRQAEENTDMVPPPGAMEEGEKESKGSMVQEVAKIVKSFYNRDNPDVGPFRGEEGIVIDVEKQISEKFGEAAGQQAGKMAEAFMAKLTQEWQQKHGNVANGHGDDGLARLKELLGHVKSKVEGIGDQGQGGKDFNKNIMPAEDQAEAYNPNSAAAEHARELKAHQRRDLETKAKSGDESAKKRLQALNDKEERMRNDYNARMERESTEMESILRLAGLAK